MKKIAFLFILFMGIIFLGSVQAASHVGGIERVGCHVNSNMCFAYIDIPITSSCASNDSFRWDITSPNGSSTLSILLAAHAAGKKVEFYESGCYMNFPSFAYLLVMEN